MRIRRWATIPLLLTVLSVSHIFSLNKAVDLSKSLTSGENVDFVIKGPVLKLMALEFDSITADFLFLKSLVFIGGTYQRTEKPRVKPWEWKWFYNFLNSTTELDPYFVDPYYLAQANLPWDGGMARETNVLLDKGSQYRNWDWMLPFFAGFNDFYFLHDTGKASDHLMIAWRRPGSPEIFAELASNLALKAKKTETSIQFLQELLNRTNDEHLKKQYKIRLADLRNKLILENGLKRYQKKFREKATTLDDLVRRGIIKEIPNDPYGGTYFVDIYGEVKRTGDIMMFEN